MFMKIDRFLVLPISCGCLYRLRTKRILRRFLLVEYCIFIQPRNNFLPKVEFCRNLDRDLPNLEIFFGSTEKIKLITSDTSTVNSITANASVNTFITFTFHPTAVKSAGLLLSPLISPNLKFTQMRGPKIFLNLVPCLTSAKLRQACVFTNSTNSLLFVCL